MSQTNGQLSMRWFDEVWNQRRSSTIDELLTPESVGHMAAGDVRGIEDFKRAHADFIKAIPDLTLRVEAIIADGDDVAVRWSASGCHSGAGFGLEATNRQVAIRGMTWHRYRGGKLAHVWGGRVVVAIAAHKFGYFLRAFLHPPPLFLGWRSDIILSVFLKSPQVLA